MALMDSIKSHPYVAVGAVVGVALLAYLLSGSSGGAPAAQFAGGNVEAATALQNAQLQAQSQGSQIAAQLQAHQSDTAAQLEIAKLAALTSTNNNDIAANVRMAEISASQQVMSLQSTLGAQVATNAQNAETTRENIRTSGVIAQQQILASALTQQAATQAAVQTQYIQSAQAVQTQSWWDKTFG